MKKKKNVNNKEEFDKIHELSEKPFTYRINQLKFKSKKQKEFFDLCRSDDTNLVICDGPAGTGKSIISLYSALKQVKSGKYDQILYVRSPVDSSDVGLGFLPGDLYDKTVNYMIPIQEKLEKFIEVEKINELFRQGIVETCVNSFMRGRSIDNTIVIIDELQNYSLREILTIFSRFEENTKIIAIGDHMQSDIGIKTCINKILDMFENEIDEANENGVFTFRFDNEDIVRSGLTKYIIKTFEKYEKIVRN
jgi:phosphate starvation-inducible PhoH-like protein